MLFVLNPLTALKKGLIHYFCSTNEKTTHIYRFLYAPESDEEGYHISDSLPASANESVVIMFVYKALLMWPF